MFKIWFFQDFYNLKYEASKRQSFGGFFSSQNSTVFLLYKAVLAFWEDKICVPRIDNMRFLANFSSTSNRNPFDLGCWCKAVWRFIPRVICIADTMKTFIWFSANMGVLSFCWIFCSHFMTKASVWSPCCRREQDNFLWFVYCNILPLYSLFLVHSFHLSFVFCFYPSTWGL